MFDGEVTIPVNEFGNPMSPIETATGVTLPIVSSIDDDPTRHHAHFHEDAHKFGSLGQRAVRFSRVQMTTAAPHRYFHNAFDGTALPASEADEYAVTILNCAGYIPGYGVRIARRDMSIDEITPEEKEALRQPGTFSIEDTADAKVTVGQFFMHYALSRKFNPDQQALVKEFLAITPERLDHNTMLRRRKIRAGQQLINSAFTIASSSVESRYQSVRDEGALRQEAPFSAWKVMKKHIGDREPEYIEMLEERLRTNHELVII
jgi:hypothetical protein